MRCSANRFRTGQAAPCLVERCLEEVGEQSSTVRHAACTGRSRAPAGILTPCPVAALVRALTREIEKSREGAQGTGARRTESVNRSRASKVYGMRSLAIIILTFRN